MYGRSNGAKHQAGPWRIIWRASGLCAEPGLKHSSVRGDWRLPSGPLVVVPEELLEAAEEGAVLPDSSEVLHGRTLDRSGWTLLALRVALEHHLDRPLPAQRLDHSPHALARPHQ